MNLQVRSEEDILKFLTERGNLARLHLVAKRKVANQNIGSITEKQNELYRNTIVKLLIKAAFGRDAFKGEHAPLFNAIIRYKKAKVLEKKAVADILTTAHNRIGVAAFMLGEKNFPGIDVEHKNMIIHEIKGHRVGLLLQVYKLTGKLP